MTALVPKSHVTPLNSHVELRNATVLSTVLSVSCDTDSSTMTQVPALAPKCCMTPKQSPGYQEYNDYIDSIT